ncbi:glycerol-3-phosphate acyltransferase [Chloroflexota bacterium]
MPAIVSGVIAVIIAYLLGSIPAAYITTRLQTGKDIRQLGGGNVGARNVFREVGLGVAVAAGVFDVGKGAAALLIAKWFLGFPSMQLIGVTQVLVLATGLAVVAGHIWSVYLKFTGGNGLSPTIGVLAVLMPRELLIAFAITILLIVITRNPVLSVNISLLFSVPVSAWFLEKSWLYIVFPIALALMLVLHFLPTAKTAFATAGSRESLLTELLRRGKSRK